jgi:hypothetical protein
MNGSLFQGAISWAPQFASNLPSTLLYQPKFPGGDLPDE